MYDRKDKNDPICLLTPHPPTQTTHPTLPPTPLPPYSILNTSSSPTSHRLQFPNPFLSPSLSVSIAFFRRVQESVTFLLLLLSITIVYALKSFKLAIDNQETTVREFKPKNRRIMVSFRHPFPSSILGLSCFGLFCSLFSGFVFNRELEGLMRMTTDGRHG